MLTLHFTQGTEVIIQYSDGFVLEGEVECCTRKTDGLHEMEVSVWSSGADFAEPHIERQATSHSFIQIHGDWRDEDTDEVVTITKLKREES